MRFGTLLIALSTVGLCTSAWAQNRLPSVADIFKQFDSNQDGVLTPPEVAKGRYARQYGRWDTDGDKKVVPADIIKMRRRFGIAADGSMLRPTRDEFQIPEVSALTRVDRTQGPSRQAARHSAFIVRTRPHKVQGEAYVILTDHSSEASLAHLQRLAQHRQGTVVTTKDLRALFGEGSEMDQLRGKLQKLEPRYVAIAPRRESFSENTLLAVWELLSTLDDDPQIDVLPGLLVASNAKALGRLIDQSIDYRAPAAEQLKPLAISQVPSTIETRSLQKAGILRNQFAKAGLKMPVVAVYLPRAADAVKLPGDQVWNLTLPQRGKPLTEFPPEIDQALSDSNLIIMHGHGTTGMSCSIDIQGVPADFRGKVLLTGSCFAAAPWKSDLTPPKSIPGGYKVEARDAFVIRAIDQGAVVAFGHQRLSAGFPFLYPVLESWLHGKTVGEAYQQLLNAVVELRGLEPGGFVIDKSQQGQRRVPQTMLLYVVIGDPALKPLPALPTDKP